MLCHDFMTFVLDYGHVQILSAVGTVISVISVLCTGCFLMLVNLIFMI